MEHTDKEEIENFEALEGGAELSGEFKDIQDIDQWMKSLPLKEVGTNFTSTVIASALLARKRHANFKILLWLMGFFCLLIVASYLLMNSPGAGSELPYLDSFRTQSVQVLDLLANPKLRQLFLIVEGIICLIVIEKIVGSYRIIRHSV